MKIELRLCFSVLPSQIWVIQVVNLLINQFLKFNMLIVKLASFLRYTDWLTCHFERFSRVDLQCDQLF